MNDKLLKTYFIIFVSLVLLFISVYIISQKDSQASNTIDITKDVTTFTLNHNQQELIFKRDGDNWKVNDYLAEKTTVNTLLDALVNGKITTKVSSNEQNYANFGLDDVSRTELIVNNKKYFIGKAANPGNYIIIDGDKNVYLFTKDLPDANKDLIYFRDKTVASMDFSNLKEIKGNFRLYKEDSLWKLDDGKASSSDKVLDQTKVEDFIKGTINIKGSSVVSVAQAGAALNKPIFTLTIKDLQDKNTTLEFYSTSDLYYIKQGDEFIQVGQFVLDNAQKKSEDLVKI